MCSGASVPRGGIVRSALAVLVAVPAAVSADGVSESYRTVSSGPDDIVADRAFNPRGGVHSESRPYYEGEASLVTRYEYDALDRVRKVFLPGSGVVQKTYDADSETTTDPNSKSTTTRFDYFGRAKAIERLFNGQPAITTIHYDRLGRRDSMTDPVQATWTWVYDSLGRVRTERDPDRGGWLPDPAGMWTYLYDDAGRQVSQTDAKDQETTQERGESLSSRQRSTQRPTPSRKAGRRAGFTTARPTATPPTTPPTPSGPSRTTRPAECGPSAGS
jgi:YD repeat-containing protein